MELVVFALAGTLLNRDSEISAYTSETLRLLSENDIAYTVATGRTLHGARRILDGHSFRLPQAYKNGVMIWHPDSRRYSSGATLTPDELESVVSACIDQRLTPFVFTLDEDQESTVYHPPLVSDLERALVDSLSIEEHKRVCPLDDLPSDAVVTHVNAIGASDAIAAVLESVDEAPHLVAYSGVALEGEQWRWLDVHHSDASKGGAIETLKALLGIERVICFGDSDNDLSMFEAADESYAPANANDRIKSAPRRGRHRALPARAFRVARPELIFTGNTYGAACPLSPRAQVGCDRRMSLAGSRRGGKRPRRTPARNRPAGRRTSQARHRLQLHRFFGRAYGSRLGEAGMVPESRGLLPILVMTPRTVARIHSSITRSGTESRWCKR